MRNYGLRAALMLACVILVVAAGACQAVAFFDSMTSMFTAVAVPQSSHAQAYGLKTNGFLQDKLGLVTQDSQPSNSQQYSVTPISLVNLNSNSNSGDQFTSKFMNTMLTPGVNESSNTAMSSYDGFLKKYTHGTGNIFEF